VSRAGWGTLTRIFASVGITSACGGNTLTRDLWVEDPPSASASEDAGVGLPDWKGPGILSPDTEDAGARVLPSSIEVWLGQAERQVTVPLGSTDGGASSPERILLIVQRRPSGITGTITFGTGAPPPPPEGPDVLYPIGRVANTAYWLWLIEPMDGFTYSLRSVHINARRGSIEFSPAELWQAWCAEQTPYANEGPSGGYACAAPGSGPFANETFCTVDATRCQANQVFSKTIDFVADQDVLTGEMAAQSNFGLGPAAIRLRRQR
jgi:hypothetical protein